MNDLDDVPQFTFSNFADNRSGLIVEMSMLSLKGTSTGCRNHPTNFIITILMHIFVRRAIFFAEIYNRKCRGIPFITHLLKYTVIWRHKNRI